MASRGLGTLTLDLVAKIGAFEAGMDKAARKTDSSMARIEKRAKAAGKAIGLALIAGATAAVAALDSTIDKMDEMSKAAQKVGISTEEFSKLTYAAELADISMETLVGSLGKLTKAQAAALKETSQQAKIFDALSISATNADGSLRESSDVLADFADRFKALEGSPEAMAAGFVLFGRSFQELIPLLKDGSAGIRAAGDELEQFGGVITTEAGEQAEQFNDDLTRLTKAAKGLAVQIATDLLPTLIDMTGTMVDVAKGAEDGAEAGDDFKVVLDGIVSIAGSVINAITSIGSVLQSLVGNSQDASESIRQLVQSARGLAAIPAGLAAYAQGIAGTITGDAAAVEDAARKYSAANRELVAAWKGTAVADFRNVNKTADFSNVVGSAGMTPDSAALRLALAGGPPKAKTGGGAKKGGKSDAEREAERLKEAYDRLTASLNEQIALTGEVSEVEKLRYELANGELAKLEPAQKQQLLDLAQIAEYKKRDLEATEEAIKLEEKETQAIKDHAKAVKEQIEDMEFELSIISLSNIEREKAIALRYANVDAMSAEGQQITALVDEINKASENQEFIDDLKNGLADMFVDFVSGAKTAKEAFGDFADAIYARALQFLADKAIQALFDSFGNKGAASGGSSGGGWANILSSIFGGARAGGGGTSAGKVYRVNENGPEMLSVSGRDYLMMGSQGGMVTPNHALAGGGSSQVNNFNFVGRVDRRTQDQVESKLAQRSRRAMSRNG